MTGLADVDGFIICIQVCLWLGFQPLIPGNFGHSFDICDQYILGSNPFFAKALFVQFI